MICDESQSPATSSRMIAPTENWQDALNNLERELAAYRNAQASRATEEELAVIAARVSAAMRLAQVAPTNPHSTKDLPPLYQPTPAASFPINVQRQMPIQSEAPPPSPTRPNKLKRDLRESHAARPDIPNAKSEPKSDNPGKQIGKGMLMIVATPIAAAGMCVYAGGMVVEGIAMMLKGMGSAGKKPLDGVLNMGKNKPRARKFPF